MLMYLLARQRAAAVLSWALKWTNYAYAWVVVGKTNSKLRRGHHKGSCPRPLYPAGLVHPNMQEKTFYVKDNSKLEMLYVSVCGGLTSWYGILWCPKLSYLTCWHEDGALNRNVIGGKVVDPAKLVPRKCLPLSGSQKVMPHPSQSQSRSED